MADKAGTSFWFRPASDESPRVGRLWLVPCAAEEERIGPFERAATTDAGAAGEPGSLGAESVRCV